jgi:predicted DNA-binding transcriptional regulator AlpA
MLAATPGDDQLIDQRGAAALIGNSERTLERWRAERTGPPYIKLSPRAVRYSRAGLIEWLRSRTVSTA